MSRPRLHIPSYRLHKLTGKAVVTVRDPDGTRREVVLGRHGSPESKAEYARICAELRPGGVLSGAATTLAVSEVILAYWKHAQAYYRSDDGTPTGEVQAIRYSLKPLRALYGHTPAADFGPKSLAAVRDHMIGLGWCRMLINRRIGKIKRVFKWAVSQELIPPAVFEGLRTVDGLRAGRSAAREKPPVVAVATEVVEKTLPRLPRTARAIIELMRHTGMRPGEACRLSLAELDRSGAVWVYRPARHKTRHHGKGRSIALGPKAQAVLGGHFGEYERHGLLPTDPTAPVFDAARDRELRHAEMRAGRKTKVQPSQVTRKKAHPKKLPKRGYSVSSLGHAVKRATELAGVASWHPNQLRHLVGTEVRKMFGLDAAQAILGHERADVTQVYAELQLDKAAAAAAAMG